MATAEKAQLPEAVLFDQDFAAKFLENNTRPGFTAISGFDSIRTRDGRTVEEVKADMYTDLKTFGQLEQRVKDQFRDPTGSGQRGYTPNQQEQSGERPEHREHIMIAQDVPKGHPITKYRPMFYRANVPITVIPTFDTNAQEFLSVLRPIRRRMFEDLAIHLGKWWGEFAAPLEDAEEFTRLHIYPSGDIVPGSARKLDHVRAIGGERVDGVDVVDLIYTNPHTGEKRILKGAMRAGPHPDVGFYTLLVGAEEPGLYLKDTEEGALAFTTARDKIVGNAADDAAVLIPGANSAIHWVGLTEQTVQRPRYSIAAFIHRRPKTEVAGEFAGARLYRRLREIGYDIPSGLEAEVGKMQPEDSQLIGQILTFSRNQPKELKSGLERYYHLTNPKTQSYEKIMERVA